MTNQELEDAFKVLIEGTKRRMPNATPSEIFAKIFSFVRVIVEISLKQPPLDRSKQPPEDRSK